MIASITQTTDVFNFAMLQIAFFSLLNPFFQGLRYISVLCNPCFGTEQKLKYQAFARHLRSFFHLLSYVHALDRLDIGVRCLVTSVPNCAGNIVTKRLHKYKVSDNFALLSARKSLIKVLQLNIVSFHLQRAHGCHVFL